MKNLKYTLLILAMLLCTVSISAQDNGLNPVFPVNVHDLQYNIVEKKTTVSSVLGTVAEAVAGQTTDNSHEDMVPAVNAAVKSAIGGVRRLSPSDADGAAFDLSGEVTRISSTTKVRTVEEKDSKGKVTKRNVNEYEGTVSIALILKDLNSGEVRTNTFSGAVGWADNPHSENEALTICINTIRRKIVNYYNSMFPLSANIIERGDEKKDKAKEMYIDLGSVSGTFKGQRFAVYEVGQVAGRETRSKVGRLKVSVVAGDDISLCKVTSGGKDIKKAFDSGKQLVVVSEE